MAIATYQKGTGAEARTKPALYNLGNAYLQANDPGKAAEYFQKALDQEGNFPEAEIGLGAAKMQLGNLDAAQTAFVKVIADHPDNADARFNLGNVLFNKGRIKRLRNSYCEEPIWLADPNLAHAHSPTWEWRCYR